MKPKRSRRTLLRWTVALIPALGGCTGLGLNMGGLSTVMPTPSQRPAETGQGVVVVSVTGNSAQTGQMESVQLRPRGVIGYVDAKVLSNVSRGFARDTALFIGVVPEGEYELARLSGPQGDVTLGDGSRRTLGTVIVKSGAVADLGRIVVTPMNQQVLAGRSGRVTSNTDLIRRFSPDNSPSLEAPPGGGWSIPRSPEDRVEEYALSRPVGADTPTEIYSGDVFAASRVGTILIRATSGRWRAVSTGRLESLLAVLPVPERVVEDQPATVVAVGEFNTIVRLDDQERVVALDAGNLPPGNLLNIAGGPAQGWFVAHQQHDKVRLFRSSKLDGGRWELLRTEDMGVSFWTAANRFWMWPTEAGFAYAVSAGRITFYDAASRAWAVRRTPGNSRLEALVRGAGGALGIVTAPVGGLAGVFSSEYLSVDDAATWSEIKSPFKIKLMPPLRLTDGTLLVGGGAFGAFSKLELQASTDQGKTWVRRSEQFFAGEQLVLLPGGGLLAIQDGIRSGGAAGLRHSADGGATWTMEYSNLGASSR